MIIVRVIWLYYHKLNMINFNGYATEFVQARSIKVHFLVVKSHTYEQTHYSIANGRKGPDFMKDIR